MTLALAEVSELNAFSAPCTSFRRHRICLVGREQRIVAALLWAVALMYGWPSRRWRGVYCGRSQQPLW
jgi:hypothetical protein